MKTAKSLVELVILLLLLTVPLVGQASAATPTKGGNLTIGVDQEAVGLDPNLVTAFSSFARVGLMYNRLVRYDNDLDIVPDLAESWDIPDNLTYTFHLRKGIKFHDGTEMTSEDVKFTLERILDPKTGSPAASYLGPVKKIEAPSKYTVTIRLKEPMASLLSVLASDNLSIVPKHAVEKYGNLQRVVVGTGPFKLAEHVPDNYMKLVRNPDYFKPGEPYLDSVTIKVIPEQMSLLAAVRSRNLDLAVISDGSVVVQAKRDANLAVAQVPSLNVRTFGFNVTKPPFNDERVRQAIALALDRDQIIAAAEFGFGQPTGPMPISAKKWALPVSAFPSYERDIAKAKKLLAEAGYPKGLNFSILCSSTYEGGLAVAQVIQNQLMDIGVNAHLDVVEWGTYIDRWVKRDYQGIVELRGGGADPDRFLYRMLHSTGSVNNFLFKNQQLDELLEKGRGTVDYKARKSVYDAAQKLIVDKAPVNFLYVGNENAVMQKYVKGFKVMPNGALYYLEETWLDK